MRRKHISLNGHVSSDIATLIARQNLLPDEAYSAISSSRVLRVLLVRAALGCELE